MQPGSIKFISFVQFTECDFVVEQDMPSHVANLVALLTVDLENDAQPGHSKQILPKFDDSPEFNIADKKMSISIYLKSLVQKELDKGEHSKTLKDPQKLMEFLQRQS